MLKQRTQSIVIVLAALFAVMASSFAYSESEQNQGGHEGPEKHGGEREGEKRRVHLTPEQRQKLAIDVMKAPGSNANNTLHAPATTAFDPDRVAKVGPLVPAKVIRVTADLGERVEAGETVVVLESVELGETKADYLRALARMETNKADYQREKQLAEDNIASEAELLEARAKYRESQAALNAIKEKLRIYGLDSRTIGAISADNETPLSRFKLGAPQSGVVQKRDLTPGDMLTPQDTPIHLVNTDKLWLMVDAYERQLPHLKPGMKVTFNVEALPDVQVTGTLDWVSRELDKKTRTVKARAVIDNANGRLSAGLFGQATLHSTGGKRFAMIPLDAVQTIHKQSMVFIPADEENAFQAVPVKLGEKAQDQVEILDGLAPGDRVVVNGAFDLKSTLTAGGRSAGHN